MSAKISVAIVGLDNWYHAFPFADILAKHERAILKAVSDHDSVRINWIKSRYRVPVYADYEAIISDPSIDAVIITACTGRHKELIEMAVAEGKHVLCDKPLDTTVEKCDSILRAVTKASTVFCMSFPRRVRPLYIEAKKLISEGAIGRPLCITETGKYRLPSKAPGMSDPGWYIKKEHSGGGGFIDHAVHQIDMLRWWLEEEVQWVDCKIKNLAFKDLEVEDYGVATMEFKNGVIATIESSWISHGPVSDVIEVQGTRGRIKIDVGAGTIDVNSPNMPSHGLRRTFVPSSFVEVCGHKIPVDGYAALFENFIACVMGEAEPAARVEDGWAATAVVAAAYEAAKAPNVAVPQLRSGLY